MLVAIQRYTIHVYLRKFKIGQNFDPTTCRKIGPRTINPCNTKKFFPEYSSPNNHVWNEKIRKWVNPISQTDYVVPTVREFFSDLKEEPNDWNDFKNASKFITRSVELEEKGKFEIEGNCSKNHFHVAGAGAPTKTVQVRNSLFEYFIDDHIHLEGQLPIKLFLAKAKEILHSFMKKDVKGEKSLKWLSFQIGGWKAGAKVLCFDETPQQALFHKPRQKSTSNN